MAKQHNWVGESVLGTPGIGAITLGGSIPGTIKFEDAFTTGDTVHYSIKDGTDREIGIGTLTTGTPWTLTRTTVLETLASDIYDNTSPTALTLTSAALVSVNSMADMPGTIVGSAITYNSTDSSPAGTIPLDTSIPQNTEGVELMTVTYTPKYANSLLKITAAIGSISTGDSITSIVALFRDSTVDAFSASHVFRENTNSSAVHNNYSIEAEVDAVSTASTTFKLHIGTSTGASVIVNGGYFGSAINTYIKVEEIRQ